MANQPETSVFSPGVYQLETNDPVIGGVGGLSNQPLLQLANRTKWLNDQVAALLADIGLLAPINSPSLTGTPRSVTPIASAIGTEIATAATVRTVAGGLIAIPVTGDTQLTPLQTAYGVIEIYGATAGDINVVFPGVAGRWVVYNGTPHHILCRTSAGTQFTSIASGLAKTVWTDGNSLLSANNDYENAALAGIPTAPTAPDLDNGAQIANTFWVTRAIVEVVNNGFAGSINANGAYQKHPSGIIIQGGNAITTSGYGDAYSFPTAFPNAMLAGVVTEGNAYPGWSSNGPGASPTIFGMQARDRGAFLVTSTRLPPGGGGAPFYVGGLSFSWLAIGY